MKYWLIPAALGAFILGVAGGYATRGGPQATSSRMVGPGPLIPGQRQPPFSPANDEEHPNGETLPVTLSRLLAGDPSKWSPRMRALSTILDRLPKEKIQGRLWYVTWVSPRLQRVAFQLFMETRDSNALELLQEMLGHISDEGVRADFAAAARMERDPIKKRAFAKIAGNLLQPDSLNPLVIDFMSDSDPEVVRLVLEQSRLSRFKDPDQQRLAAALMRSAAAPDKSKQLRVQALRSLRGTNDPQDARFLMDIVVRDPDPGIQGVAMEAVPASISFKLDNRSLVVEMVQTLFGIATDSSRSLELRKSAAFAADDVDFSGEDKILTPAQSAMLEDLMFSQEKR